MLAARQMMHPRPRRRVAAKPSASDLSARLERLYVACVALCVAIVGMAIGFTFGVVPYYGAAQASPHDLFFGGCVGVCTLLGFAVGLANGPRWYHASEPPPTTQRRMLSYLRRRGVDSRGVPQRTIHGITVRPFEPRRV